VPPASHLSMGTDPVPRTCFHFFKDYWTMDKVQELNSSNNCPGSTAVVTDCRMSVTEQKEGRTISVELLLYAV
jgi:hypothetical protein